MERQSLSILYEYSANYSFALLLVGQNYHSYFCSAFWSPPRYIKKQPLTHTFASVDYNIICWKMSAMFTCLYLAFSQTLVSVICFRSTHGWMALSCAERGKICRRSVEELQGRGYTVSQVLSCHCSASGDRRIQDKLHDKRGQRPLCFPSTEYTYT